MLSAGEAYLRQASTLYQYKQLNGTFAGARNAQEAALSIPNLRGAWRDSSWRLVSSRASPGAEEIVGRDTSGIGRRTV